MDHQPSIILRWLPHIPPPTHSLSFWGVPLTPSAYFNSFISTIMYYLPTATTLRPTASCPILCLVLHGWFYPSPIHTLRIGNDWTSRNIYLSRDFISSSTVHNAGLKLLVGGLGGIDQFWIKNQRLNSYNTTKYFLDTGKWTNWNMPMSDLSLSFYPRL